jgi:hypothetical protein
VARKSNHKKSSYARVHTTKGKTVAIRSKSRSAPRVYAKTAKFRHTPSKSRGAVVQASMFGGPSLATRSGSHAKKKQVALFGGTKNSGTKNKSQVAKGHKSSEIRLARKNHGAKANRSRKSSRRAKDKLSHRSKKGRRAILVSEAR